MKRYKKAPDGQWPGYPHLRLNDIETLTIRKNQYISESLVNNLKGRVVLHLDKDLHAQFLETVRKRKGDISAKQVNEATLEALKAWMKKK